MVQDLMKLRTDPSLLNKLQAAATHKWTQDELLEQRVSFVFSSLSAESGVTRERVRAMLLQQDGETAAAK